MRRNGPDGDPLPPHSHVFGNEVGEPIDSVKTAWQATCKRGIKGLTFHDLRREHGSRLLEGGVNLLTVSRLLGHARVSTADTYLKASEHVSEQELRQFHRRPFTQTLLKSRNPTLRARANERPAEHQER